MYCLVIGRVWIVVYIVWDSLRSSNFPYVLGFGICLDFGLVILVCLVGWLCYWFVCYFIGLVYLFGGFGICFGVVGDYFLGFFKEFKLSICFWRWVGICLDFGLVILVLLGGLVMLLVCLLFYWFGTPCL